MIGPGFSGVKPPSASFASGVGGVRALSMPSPTGGEA